MAWHAAIQSLLILFLVCLHSEEEIGRVGAADTLSPTAANASRPLYSDWKSNKQIIDLNVSLRQTLGG